MEGTDWTLRFAAMAVAGLASGYVSGLFGVGGGIVRIPLLLYLFPLFGMPAGQVMHLSAGTSLALAIPATLLAARTHYQHGNLDLGFLRSWIPGLLAGIAVGIALSGAIHGHTLRRVFAVAVLVAAGQMLFSGDDFRLTRTRPGPAVRALVAVPLGALSTLLGLSGGSFITPVLAALGYPIHSAIAVSAAGGVPISVIGATGAVWNGLGKSLPWGCVGYCDLVAVAAMLPTVLLAAPMGARLAVRFDQHRLKRVFGVFLLVVAADMLR